MDQQMQFRKRIFEWLKQANMDPQTALGVLTTLAGTMGAKQKVGRGSFKRACLKAFDLEKKRLKEQGF